MNLYINHWYSYVIKMKFIDNLLANPFLIILGLNVLMVFGGIAYIITNRLKIKHYVMYFSEGERLFERVTIDAISPKSLFSIKRGFRFIRVGTSYKNRIGNEVLWLAKRGIAYLYTLENTTKNVDIALKDDDGNVVKDEDGNIKVKTETRKVAKKIGTLYEGLKSVLGDELVEQFSVEVKEKLTDPNIYLTVELEGDNIHNKLPKLDEMDIKNENSERMSKLIFSGIKEAMKEDYIRLFGIVAMGVAATLVAIKLGLL